jgi:hypothetical protein
VTGQPTEAGAGRRRSRPRVLANVALALVGVLASLAVCELVLRLLGIAYPVYLWTDPVRGVAHIPGMRSARQADGQSLIEINSDGLRGPEIKLKRPPGTYRIALLGDSFIEAFEVPFDKTVGEVVAHRLTEARGSPVEVINFGVGGYGTAQELLTVRHEVWRYAPDLVLLAVTTGNDISNNYAPMNPGDYRPYFVYRGDRLVLDTTFLSSREYRSRALWTRRLLGVVRHSRLAQLINRVRHLRRKDDRQQANAGPDSGDEIGLRDEVQMPPRTADWQEAWRVTEGILHEMRDECRSHHTPLAIVTLTRGIQVTPDREKKERFLRQIGAKDLYYPERRISAVGAREGIPVLNLAPAMAAEAEARQVYFHADHGTPGVGHWNEAGHAAAGKLVASWLAGLLATHSPAAVGPATSHR